MQRKKQMNSANELEFPILKKIKFIQSVFHATYVPIADFLSNLKITSRSSKKTTQFDTIHNVRQNKKLY